MYSPLVLAYLGDAVYELYIRQHLIKKIYKVKDLQKESVNYVSAKSQRKILENLINDRVLSNEEKEIITKGRNAKGELINDSFW